MVGNQDGEYRPKVAQIVTSLFVWLAVFDARAGVESSSTGNARTTPEDFKNVRRLREWLICHLSHCEEIALDDLVNHVTDGIFIYSHAFEDRFDRNPICELHLCSRCEREQLRYKMSRDLIHF